MNTKFLFLLVIAVTAGLLIAWIDSTPGWDDTGIIAGMIVIVTVTLGAIMPRRAAIWAIAVGAWIPLWNLSHGSNYGSLLALIIAIIGAFAGAFGRKYFGGNTPIS
jgi:hypothetical protein